MSIESAHPHARVRVAARLNVGDPAHGGDTAYWRPSPRRSALSVGTAFHPRTAPLNRKMQWREWSGYYASSAYADFHDIEYNAIREAAAVIDVSPLYKYRIKGPDAIRLADRVITRDATKLKVGQVYYTPWCDEHGKVIDDGTVHRVARGRAALDRGRSADPLAGDERRGPRRGHRGRHRGGGGARAPGPVQPRRPRGGDRRGLRRPALLPPPREQDRPHEDRRQPHRLHGRPGLRAVDPGRARRGRVGRRVQGRRGLRDPARRHARPRRHAAGGGADPARGRLHVRAPRDEPRAELQPVRDRPRPPGQLRQGGLRRATRPEGGTGSRRPAAQAGGPDARLVRHRAPVRRAGPAAGHLADHRPIARPRVRRGRAAGRQGHLARLEPDPQAGDRARVGRPALRARRHQASRSSGPSRAAAAGSTPRSSSCRSSTSSASGRDRRTGRIGRIGRLRGLRPPGRGAPRALDRRARRVPRDPVRGRRRRRAPRRRRLDRRPTSTPGRDGRGARGRRRVRRWSSARSATGRAP